MITVSELKQRLNDDQDLVVLDVRTLQEYAVELGHIPGSQNIPVEELRQRLGELNGDRQPPITLVCRTERRSATAAEVLDQVGFTHVAVLCGGMRQWNSAGLPVER